MTVGGPGLRPGLPDDRACSPRLSLTERRRWYALPCGRRNYSNIYAVTTYCPPSTMPSAGRLTRDDTKYQCQTTDTESALRSGARETS
jgi:hypothetical protein